MASHPYTGGGADRDWPSAWNPPKFLVAKNQNYPTRPLYDGALFESTQTWKAIGRIEVDRPCEGKTIHETGTTLKNYYQYATNADGLRGLTICRQ